MEHYQRINLTLTDFAESPVSTESAFEGAYAHALRCGTEYALIVDKSAGRNTSVCANKRRTTNVYLSRANSLEVFVTGSGQVQRSNQRFFLIKYEGNVIKALIASLVGCQHWLCRPCVLFEIMASSILARN